MDNTTKGCNKEGTRADETRTDDEVFNDVPDYRRLKVEDVKAMTFKTVEDAERFYSAYSLALGFGFRKDTKGEAEGTIRRRQWLCNKQGTRAKKWFVLDGRGRTPRKITRVNCKAKFRVNYNELVGAYVVKAFVPEHSHELATGNQTAFIRSHRNVGKSDLARANTMSKVSIRPCHAYEYMVEQAGGYKTVGFTEKDLYNKLDQQRRTTSFESDSEGALAYMNALAAQDPYFYCRFNVDIEDRLANMFWRDGHAFVDFMCYGDVLIFDSTYKTNVYKKPLVLFVGSNNHRGSILFGAALLVDETVETYTWLLRSFLDAMNGKMPIAVLTDGDEAMRSAIEDVMPQAKHRLCAWHLSRNANTNLKCDEKLKAFNRCMRKFQTVEQFEVMWHDMVEKFDLHNSFWINMMYEKRDKWAQAFFRNHFMAGMRSTQRCEGMNRFIKDSIGSGMKLVEVVPRMDRALMRLRNNQVRDDFNTMNSTPVLETHLKDLENHAASIYTYDVFKWVRKEIRKESQATLRQGPEYFEDGHRVYTMSAYKRPDFEHKVVYYHGKNTESATDPIMVCSCNMFQYRGVPCRHMFTVMKHEHINEIPKSLIVKRWSKSARDVCSIKYPEQDISKEALEVSRYGAMSVDCNRMCFYASKSEAGYNMLKREINRLTTIMEGLLRGCEQVQSIATPKSKGCVLRDPITAKTKGREAKSDKKYEPSKRPITCSYCKGPGHNTQTCEDRKEKEAEKRGGKEGEKTGGEGSNTPWNATPAKRSIHCSRCKGAGHTYRTCKKVTSF